MTVVILEDAAADIESGRQFYETREQGSAIISLSRSYQILVPLCSTLEFTLYALAFIACYQSAFLLAFTTRLNAKQPLSTRFWTCAETRFGSIAN